MAKLIDLSKERFDVAPLTKTKRIIFYAETKECLVYSDINNAKAKWERDGRVGIIISPDKAAKTIPEFFYNSNAKVDNRPTRTFPLAVPKEMFEFLESKGNKSEYIRSLIEREMKA
jgi:hypothetical protein